MLNESVNVEIDIDLSQNLEDQMKAAIVATTKRYLDETINIEEIQCQHHLTLLRVEPVIRKFSMSINITAFVHPETPSNITDCYAEDGEPIKCFSCGSTELEDKVEDVVQGTVCEKTRVCKICNTRLSSWDYGNWESYF